MGYKMRKETVMDTVYVVERWFDQYTYEGIFGVFLARGLADQAISEQLERERGQDDGYYTYYVVQREIGQIVG
jgi:hypothetical protein